MPFYIKKPIPVEAREITQETADELSAWSGSDVVKRPDGTISGLMIYTLEGTMSAAIGDYIIKGPKGEFWFNKRNIFEEMYEEVVND